MKINPDPSFKKEIASVPGGENIMSCFLCGACTAGCPVSEIDASFSPRTIMKLALLGARDELLASPVLWKCSQCHTCVAHCPQDARPADVIRVLRVLSVASGAVSEEMSDRFAALEDEMKKTRLDKINGILNEIV